MFWAYDSVGMRQYFHLSSISATVIYNNGHEFLASMNKLDQNTKKIKPLKKAQNNKIGKYCRLGLSLFMDGTGKCILPSTPSRSGLIHHIKMIVVNYPQIYSHGGYPGILNVTSAIP